jgi:abhydrolase domain-containing protein 17
MILKTALFNWLTQIPDGKVLLRIPVIAYMTIALYAYFLGDRQILLPQYATNAPLPNPPIVLLPDDRNCCITLVHYPQPNAQYTILYSHGNAETLGDVYPHLQRLKNLGFNVVAYDYRGYGASLGTPSEANTYGDITAAYRYTRDILKVPADRIIVFGRSVGSGPSTYLASTQPIAGLILESAFISAFRVVVPFRLLPFDKYPNADRLAKITVPLLVIHGDRDQVIPYSHGQTLFQVAPGPKRWLTVPNADHNDVSAVGGPIYDQAIQDFAKNLPQSR